MPFIKKLSKNIFPSGTRPIIIERLTEESEINTILTLETALGGVRKVTKVTVGYDASVTETAVVTLISGAGSVYNIELATVDLSAADAEEWIPTGELWLGDDDRLEVVVPAVVAQKGNVAIYSEVF